MEIRPPSPSRHGHSLNTELSQTAVDQHGDSIQTYSLRSSWSWVSLLTSVVLAVIATALRFKFLSRKPFWFDECFSAVVARLSWHDFARLLWWREANMSLYYLFLRAWLTLGFTPFFIRSLSVLCSLATVPAIFWLGCKLFDRRVGLIAAALLACNAYSIRYAQEARSYALFLFLATLSSCPFVAWLRNRSRRNRAAYILVSTLAVYAHFYALLLITVHWLAERLIERGEQVSAGPLDSASKAHGPWITIGLAVLPLLAFVTKTGAGPIRWIARPTLHDLLDFFQHLAGNRGTLLLLLYTAAGLAAILPYRKRLRTTTPVWEAWRLQFLLIWLFLPAGLALLLSFARPVFLGRYFIFCLPPLIILAAAGLDNLRKSWMTALCLAAMLLLSLQGTLSYYDHDFDLERDGSEAAANYIQDHSQAGDAIVFHIAEARIPYEFFRSLRERNSRTPISSGPEIIFPRHGDRLDYRDVTGKPTPELIRSLSSRYARVWVVLMRNGTPDHPDPTTVMLGQILSESFPRMQSNDFPQVQVRLYGNALSAP